MGKGELYSRNPVPDPYVEMVQRGSGKPDYYFIPFCRWFRQFIEAKLIGSSVTMYSDSAHFNNSSVEVLAQAGSTNWSSYCTSYEKTMEFRMIGP
jgi:hypothetical protein